VPAPQPAPSDLRRAPRRYSAARLAAYGAVRWLGARAWPGRAAYARWLARGGVRGERVELRVPGLPPAADGLRLVQLSDVHAGPFLDEAALQPALELARSFEPHLLALTGDFITDTADDVALLGRAFAGVPAPLGAFAVFGNHDYRGRRERELVAWLRRQGVRALRNAAVELRHGGARVLLAGLEDIEESRGADLAATLRGSDGREHLRVLLCHHPDVVDALPPGAFHLVLAGHSHGGQLVLPLLGPVARGWLPRRVRGGCDLAGGGRLHVNRGIGVLVLPLRVGAPAEVTCVTFRTAAGPA